MQLDDGNSTLRYVDASRLRSQAGRLADIDLRGMDDEKIGNLDGVLIDPVERRLRFFVVESSGWFGTRRYLLPTDCPAQVDRNGRSLRIAVDRDGLAQCEEFERSSVPESQDADLLDAMFGRRIA